MTQDKKSVIPSTQEEFRELADRIAAYSKSTHSLNQDRPQLLKQYPNEWVAYYEAKLVAHSKDYDELRSQLKERGIPLNESAVRFLNENPPKYIFKGTSRIRSVKDSESTVTAISGFIQRP